MANETESVRIEKKVLDKVRKVITSTRQTISGFVSLEVEKAADKKLKIKK